MSPTSYQTAPPRVPVARSSESAGRLQKLRTAVRVRCRTERERVRETAFMSSFGKEVTQALVKSVDNLRVPDVDHVINSPTRQEVTDEVAEVREARWCG